MIESSDPYHLERFAAAQAAIYPTVIAELGSGRKRSHWMWFMFPQVLGLGASAMARQYAISGLGEAAAFLAHPVLGPRLVECTGLVVAIEGTPLETILGSPDNLKFHSSVTLFSLVPGHDEVIDRALGKYFGGAADDNTIAALARLEAGGSSPARSVISPRTSSTASTGWRRS